MYFIEWIARFGGPLVAPWWPAAAHCVQHISDLNIIEFLGLIEQRLTAVVMAARIQQQHKVVKRRKGKAVRLANAHVHPV